MLPGVMNARLEVREENEDVTFLYKVVPGAAQKSYGIYVAKLAGLPSEVIDRAKEILSEDPEESLSRQEDALPRLKQPETLGGNDNERAQTQAVIDRLVTIDLLHTTPLEALVLLSNLKKLLGREGG